MWKKKDHPRAKQPRWARNPSDSGRPLQPPPANDAIM